jgi:hypothetical protein
MRTPQVINRHVLVDGNNHGRRPSIGEEKSNGKIRALILIADWHNGRESGDNRSGILNKVGVGHMDAERLSSVLGLGLE